LVEAKSLLGPTFDPKRIIDAGIGCGAASAAVLDVFGGNQIDWIHGIDPSKSQREAAEAILNSIVLERTEASKTATQKAQTRVTVSETITQVGGKTGEGTFDLALCCKCIPCSS
jgi:ribosomal protein RSM22 (predicted rRNA methylase)